MKKTFGALFIALALLITSPFPVYAGKTRVHISAHFNSGVPGYHAGWGHHGRYKHHRRGHRYHWHSSWVVGPGPWYPHGYYAPPPVIIQQEQPVYAQPEQPEESYWYYCRNPEGYYPYIRSCQDGWMKVVPDVTPPNQ